jgi:DNA-binding LacI/PurR family transcriptional regulator
MMALQSHGISIPQDVIIGGFDDTTVSQYTTPQLSSVRIDTTKMGHLAIQIMMQQLGHSEGPASNRIQLPTKLVPRTSTIGMMP